MMPDIFSSFDPMAFSQSMPTHITLTMSIIIILITQLMFWNTNQINVFIMLMKSTIIMQLLRTQMKYLKGMSTIITSLFMLIITMNLLGLNPYTLSITSHLMFTLSLGLPLWLSMIISSMSLNIKQFVAHFLPDGAPTWLNPFLILIETVSISVRPLTLSFRLAANMSAGHIVLGLASLYGAAMLASCSIKYSIILMMIIIGYAMFEMAICLIQAYIFCLLLSLYSDDHSHPS